MCDYKIMKLERPIKDNGKIVLLNREFFNKLSSENYLKVLSSDNREKIRLSKSYYYYILEEFKENGIIEDNAIAFKAIIPFISEGTYIKIDSSILYVNENMIFYIDMGSTTYSCGKCPVVSLCIYGLRKIAKEMKVKVNTDSCGLPAKMWEKLVSSIFQKSLINVNSIKL